MNFISEPIKKSWNDIPGGARSFLKKAVLLFIFWKCLYFLTIDKRIFDKPLTNLFASHTALAMNLILQKDSQPYDIISKSKGGVVTFDGKNVLGIGDACNALELFVLYLGFIICMPAALKKKIFWSVAGVFLIHFINILRGCGLIYLYQYHQSHFDFAHKYLFKITVYAVVFFLWVLFTKGLKFQND